MAVIISLGTPNSFSALSKALIFFFINFLPSETLFVFIKIALYSSHVFVFSAGLATDLSISSRFFAFFKIAVT